MKTVTTRLATTLFALGLIGAHAQIVFQDNFTGVLNPAWSVLQPDTTY